jgi:hypothetical protein
MSLRRVTTVDRIEVLEDGTVQVRHATYIEENGQRITEPTYHRVTYAPGVDVKQAPARVQAVAGSVWTPDVVDAARAKSPTLGA